MKLMLAVPTHAGSVDVVTATTMMTIQRLVLGDGGHVETRIHSASVLPMLRNIIVADFLTSRCDALFMLDADQGVSEAGLVRMLGRMRESGADMVGCFYPKRGFNWSLVEAGESAADIDRLLYQAMDFVGQPRTGADGSIALDDGFAQADHVGTGALLLRKAVFDRMRAAYPDLAAAGFSAVEFPTFAAEYNWGFFNPLPNDGVGGGMLSEDLSFCRRWRAIGGEIWADAATPVAHVGRHIWSGSYADFLSAIRPGGAELDPSPPGA